MSSVDIAAMEAQAHGNVIYLHQRRRWRTHCLDCDPAASTVFDLAVRADARTGEILTPCPSCGHVALVETRRPEARASGNDDR